MLSLSDTRAFAAFTLVFLSLGEAVLDHAAEREASLALDLPPFFKVLLSSSGDFSVVEVFFEENGRVIVDLRGLDGEGLPVPDVKLRALIEGNLRWVLLTRVAAIKGEVGEILTCHVEL